MKENQSLSKLSFLIFGILSVTFIAFSIVAYPETLSHPLGDLNIIGAIIMALVITPFVLCLYLISKKVLGWYSKISQR